MEHLKTAALVVHIIGGSVALLAGLFNMIARKGGPRHCKAGNLFAWGMYAVAISALVLSIYIDSLFFFCLGIFTFYMTWNGQRSATLRKVIFDRSDRVILLIGTLNTILMLVNGNAILFGLGVLSATLVVRELILFRKVLKGLEVPANTWLVRHIGMMVGSYISTLTAFLVVNWDGIGPYWVPWALPSVVLVPYIVWWSRKVTKRRARRKVVAAAILLLPVIALSQPYIDGGNTRHRFAQMNFGADLLHVPQGGSTGAGAFSDRGTARLLIGGTHFWGHADFVLGIPITSWGGREASEGVETIVKLYPWRIRSKKLRPFAGFSWAVFSTRIGDGVALERSRLPLLGGITLLKKKVMFELGARYPIGKKEPYWISRNEKVEIELPTLGIFFGMKWMFDTTLSAEAGHLSGRTQAWTDTLARSGSLNGTTIGAGVGTAAFLQRSEWLRERTPWLDDNRMSATYAHFHVGHYLHRPDLQIALTYRRITDALEAFGDHHRSDRRSLSLEAYHFFADLHGFVPFVGGLLSHERLKVEHLVAGKEPTGSKASGVRPGITAGWDIRPNRLQAFLLRTQLRYVPQMAVQMPDGGELHTDQLEIDFIQLILFPSRLL